MITSLLTSRIPSPNCIVPFFFMMMVGVMTAVPGAVAGPSTQSGIASPPAGGRDVLSLQQAIRAALEYNHGLRISRIETEKADNSATRGNAGQYPGLSLSGQLTQSYTDVEITPGSLLPTGSSGQPASTRSIDGVNGTQADAGLAAEYIIYDGFQSRLRYALLQNGARETRLQQRAAAETTILDITRRYLALAGLQQQIDVQETQLQQSRQRYRTAEARREYGQASGQQRLQALADLNTDSTDYRNLQTEYDQAYRELHAAIGWDERLPGRVETQLDPAQTGSESNLLPGSTHDYRASLEAMMRDNTTLRRQQQRIEAAELQQELARAARYPRLTATARYGYSYERSDIGLFEEQQRLGASGSIGLQVPIFTGGQRRIREQNAEASRRQAEINRQQTRLELRSRFENIRQELQHLRRQLQSEAANSNIYRRNYERAQAAFREGQISGVELRSAQLGLQQSRLRYIRTHYQLRLNDTLLRYLSGQLLQETASL